MKIDYITQRANKEFSQFMTSAMTIVSAMLVILVLAFVYVGFIGGVNHFIFWIDFVLIIGALEITNAISNQHKEVLGE